MAAVAAAKAVTTPDQRDITPLNTVPVVAAAAVHHSSNRALNTS
jgi:hypothetical protein